MKARWVNLNRTSIVLTVNMVIQTEVPKEKPAKRICDATYPMSKIISSCATLESMLAAPTWKEVLLGGIG